MASGPALYVVRVEHRVSSLQLLCQEAIASALREDKDVSKLTLPPRLCSYLSTAFTPTIKVRPLHPLPAGSPARTAGPRRAGSGKASRHPRAGEQKSCLLLDGRILPMTASECCLSLAPLSRQRLALCEGPELPIGKGSGRG